MEKRMDIFIIMIVMLVNCMQTVYVAFVLSNKWELPVFIEGDFPSIEHCVLTCIFLNYSKQSWKKSPGNYHFSFILSNHTDKRAEKNLLKCGCRTQNSTWVALPVLFICTLKERKEKKCRHPEQTKETKTAQRALRVLLRWKSNGRQCLLKKGTTTACQDSTKKPKHSQ